jgi:opacity protein-like surface antigen
MKSTELPGAQSSLPVLPHPPARKSGLIAICLAALVSLCACTGGHHAKGDGQWSLVASHGSPTQGRTLWPEAKGDAENIGAAAEYAYFATDRLAVAGAIGVRRYDQPEGDVTAGEIQLGLRYHAFSFRAGEIPLSVYAELFGGLQSGNRAVPLGGSKTNFTQDTGLGLEAQLSERTSWLLGYRLKHLSNAEIFGDSNPSQNDHQVYAGLAFRLD